MNGIEKQIARAVASALINAGHKITVDYERGYDTEDQNRDLTDLDKIIEASDAVDECWWMLDAEPDPEAGACATGGWVYFIWGNGDEGRTCVSDYAGSLEPLLEHIWPWAEYAEAALVGQPTKEASQFRRAAEEIERESGGMSAPQARELHEHASRLEKEG
jgi:hypothetical protein